MAENDNLENYIFIRHKLFRINISYNLENMNSQLSLWRKSTLESDFGKDAWKKVKIVKDPINLSPEMKNYYINYLESVIYKWHQIGKNED